VGHPATFAKFRMISITTKTPVTIAMVHITTRAMSIFPSTIDGLTRMIGVLNWFYLTALVVGVISTAGIVHFSGVLQKAKDEQLAQQRIAADVKIAEANKVAALANQRAEELEKENLEIRKQMADRFLVDPERKAFIGQVRIQGRQIKVTKIGDPEAQRYATMIASALTEAGWGVENGFIPIYDRNPAPKGVICRVSKQPDAAVRLVIDALGRAGANPRIEEAQSAPAYIEIVVGSKPK
jgi:hypothetical protein